MKKEYRESLLYIIRCNLTPLTADSKERNGIEYARRTYVI